MDLPKSLEAPIAKGQKIGMVKVTLDGKVVAQSPLVALQAVEEGGFFKRLWHSLLMGGSRLAAAAPASAMSGMPGDEGLRRQRR